MNIKVCCGLTMLAAKHHKAVCSPSPLPIWDGGKKQEKDESLWVEIKTVY